MAEEFLIKRNDTSPSFLYKVTPPDGTTLTGATVRFHMAQEDGTVVVDEAGSVDDVTNNILRYDWGAADTANAGLFKAEFEVTYSGGAVETFPNSGYERVKILEDLA